MSAIEDTDAPSSSQNESAVDGEFERLKRMVSEGWKAMSDWRKEAIRSFNFVANHQWSDEDMTILNDQNRPAVTFNRCAPIIKAVCGLEVNNRKAVTYLPREQGDVGVNETITAAGKWIRDECGAEFEESTAFRDLTICGVGWTDTRMEYDEDTNGKVYEERIDPLEMGVNKGACKSNFADAKMIFRVRDMDPEDARELLQLDDAVLADVMHCRWLADTITPADGGEGNKKDYPNKTRDGVSAFRGQRKHVRIVQCQYWERQTIHLVATATDEEIQELSAEEFEMFKSRAEQLQSAGQPLEYDHVAVPQKVFYECFLMDRAVAGKQPMKVKMFRFRAMTGERDREKKCFYGMLRDMFDPQMWANKWLSQTMHIMNTNAKGGLLAETDAFANVRKAERDWADNTKIVWVKPGSLQKQKIKERTAPPLPQGLGDLMMFAISSLRDVTGVNLELLGQADREQAASLEMQRRQSAMTILATMFDSLRKYRKSQGKLLLHFIWMLPDNTLIRVLEQGKHKYIPLVKEKDVEKYDVIIDEAPSSPNEKQFIWAITAQIMQMGVLPPAALIELLKYSPYPETVVAEIRKSMGMDGEMPPEQLQQKLQQAEQALQVMEEQLAKAMEAAKTAEDDRAVEMLKLEIDEYKAKTERMRVKYDALIKSRQLQGEGQGGGNGRLPAVQVEDVIDVGLDEGNEETGLVQLNQKVDALAEMLGQALQAMGGGAAPEPAPVVEPAAPPPAELLAPEQPLM